ncbi:hypothetical protein WICPIJ_006663, partial [Wickerhamomyces pijperi]
MDVTSPHPRTSLGSIPRPSLTLSRSSMEGIPANVKNHAAKTIDSVLSEDDQRQEIEDIVKRARKSLHLKQIERYNLKDENSYIPSDRLVRNEEYVLEKTIEHIEDFST